MDCDTSDQWSGIELLRVFFLNSFLNFLFCMGFCVDGNAMDCDTSEVGD